MPEKDQTMSDNSNIYWVEKYRPKQLDQLISHQNIINTLSKFIAENRLPHLLLYGPPGTGKTSTILACAQQLYSPQQMASMVLELNASDERGIDVVRGPILNFASTKAVFKSGFKLIILDECDAMTNDAQNALRRIMEKFSVNVRFCLICNYLSKIIPALQSRCTRFRFAPLSTSQIIPRVKYIVNEEQIKATDDGIKALIDLSDGDMRKVLNILQSTSAAFDEINEHNVYLCCGHPLKEDIENILNLILNKKFSSIYESIMEMKREKGLALQDIITDLHPYVNRIDFPTYLKIEILEKMANIEYQLSSGSSERLQLAALIGAFQTARDISQKS
ncbi:replication factor C subunit 5-like [Oppia nitens]|uniref:replication factor C subunit 5-like n=1 Tax=Oppia nitens TaxID=1686743 RepID=UPI0023DBA471|nr:replication factor C subunit 5-like [Oppia nitens]